MTALPTPIFLKFFYCCRRQQCKFLKRKQNPSKRKSDFQVVLALALVGITTFRAINVSGIKLRFFWYIAYMVYVLYERKSNVLDLEGMKNKSAHFALVFSDSDSTCQY